MKIIETNPMKFVTIPLKKGEKYYVKEEKNFFTKDELNQFLNIIKTEENLPSFILYHILAFTGEKLLLYIGMTLTLKMKL